MYKIFKDSVQIGVTDAPSYIRLHNNGCYILCDEAEAQGIAYEGNVYHLLNAPALEGAETVTLQYAEVSKELQSSADLSDLTFVVLAEAELLDDVTITEHSGLFISWDPNWTGPRGAIVQDEGGLYKAIHPVIDPSQNRKPSTDTGGLLWRPLGKPGEEWPEWSQPILPSDGYELGAKCRSVDHGNAADPTVYKWIVTQGGGDGRNVWAPGLFGWEKQGVYEGG